MSIETQPRVQEQIKQPEQEVERSNWWNIFFGALFSTDYKDTDEKTLLDEQARLQALLTDRRDPMQIGDAGVALIPIQRELLRRRDPKARAIIDRWSEIQARQGKEREIWEKHILETEGEEALRKKYLDHEIPESYTRDELQVFVQFMQTQANAGIIHPDEVEMAYGALEMGGIQAWFREDDKQISLNQKQELLDYLERRPDRPEADKEDTRRIIANIDRQAEEKGWYEQKNSKQD